MNQYMFFYKSRQYLRMIMYTFCVYGFVAFLLLACSNKDKTNTISQEVNEVIDNTITNIEGSMDEEVKTEINENEASVSNEYPQEYAHVLQWASVQIAQENANIIAVEQDNSFFDFLEKNVHIGYEYPFFIPYDTRIGFLENVRKKDASIEKIVSLVKSFFIDISTGAIDANIARYVLSEEVPVVIRQLAFSQNYGKNITEYRLGKLITAEKDRRFAKTRVFALFPDFEARVELIIYFNAINNNWFISAIEGDINELLTPYTDPTRFEPSGTTGVSQGF